MLCRLLSEGVFWRMFQTVDMQRFRLVEYSSTQSWDQAPATKLPEVFYLPVKQLRESEDLKKALEVGGLGSSPSTGTASWGTTWRGSPRRSRGSDCVGWRKDKPPRWVSCGL